MNNSAALPLAILFLGAALIAGFMAFRPWPAPQANKPIKPGAYFIEILRGQPPAASIEPDRQTEITAIQDGLWVILGIWATSKAASALGSLGTAVGSIAGGIAGLWGKISGWLKGIGKVGSDIPDVPVV